jgi:hypothetical protein
VLIGCIDQVRLWTRTLTSTEITNAYSNPTVISTTSLQFYYKFNQITGGQITDYSGVPTPRTLTITGQPIFEIDSFAPFCL